jgi:DNA modification methylase
MGSGTTAVSALKSGRKFIGYEVVKEYIELAENRIDSILKQIAIKYDLV